MIDRLLLPFTGPALFTRECELTLAAEAAGRPMAVVKVLPLLELVVEQLGVIDQHALRWR